MVEAGQTPQNQEEQVINWKMRSVRYNHNRFTGSFARHLTLKYFKVSSLRAELEKERAAKAKAIAEVPFLSLYRLATEQDAGII